MALEDRVGSNRGADRFEGDRLALEALAVEEQERAPSGDELGRPLGLAAALEADPPGHTVATRALRGNRERPLGRVETVDHAPTGGRAARAVP